MLIHIFSAFVHLLMFAMTVSEAYSSTVQPLNTAIHCIVKYLCDQSLGLQVDRINPSKMQLYRLHLHSIFIELLQQISAMSDLTI